ncbi:MAG: LysR family transcriptional regulator [Blautia sp.]|nr:LysR family transcriptional regulator [Blautia sp.]
MDTRTFEYLLAVEREGSITKAAEACFVSQPALTQKVKKLEEKLDVTIFQKEEEGLVPTPMGRIILNTALRILHIEEEMEREIGEIRREQRVKQEEQ